MEGGHCSGGDALSILYADDGCGPMVLFGVVDNSSSIRLRRMRRCFVLFE